MNFEGGSSQDQFKDLNSQIRAGREQLQAMAERVRSVREALCAKEKPGGAFEIDFKALVTKLGRESANELRTIINEVFGGAAPGEGSGGGIHPLAHLVGETVTILSAGDGQKPKLRILPKAEAPRVKRKYTKRAKAA